MGLSVPRDQFLFFYFSHIFRANLSSTLSIYTPNIKFLVSSIPKGLVYVVFIVTWPVKFWEISDNISEMVQDRDTVAMEV